MKKLIYSIAALTVLLVSSCGDDFLETKNLYDKGLDNFYQSPTDIEEAMGGVYNTMYTNSVFSDEHVAANLLSDLMLAGGGPDDQPSKNVDAFLDPEEDTYKDLWVETYNGIYRCNAIIEAVTEADFMRFFKTEDEAIAFKNKALGEAYFMRGFLLFKGAKFFGGMPLVPTTDSPRDVARSSFTETFTQIVSDLRTAVETMANTKSTDFSIDEYGHANKWVAEGMLARVFLFYTGYMTNIEKNPTTEMQLAEGSITKNDVVAYLEDCISNSGYELLPDFRNLWPYSFVNERAGKTVLPWAENEALAWAGQDGPHSVDGTGNNEVMFALRYAFGNWAWPHKAQAYNNRTCLYFGIRDNSMVPFGQGWGWGTIQPLLFSQWDDADLRKKGSIIEMGDAEQATDTYEANKGDHETGMFNKKYTTIQHDGVDGVVGMFAYLYDMDSPDMQLWSAQDFYFLRFADIYLMHSELTETATSLNIVRNRAGLADVAYSLDNLKEERKHEFAFEGLRWFDLVRWGDVENDANNYYKNDVPVMNSDGPGKYSVNYRAETKGLVSIPESEIRLSNGVYEQNPGW